MRSGLLGSVLFFLLIFNLVISNPSISDYQHHVLEPVIIAWQAAQPPDLPKPAAPVLAAHHEFGWAAEGYLKDGNGRDRRDLRGFLLEHTITSNYGLFSLYLSCKDAEHSGAYYLGIAGRFIKLSKGTC